MIFDAQNLFSDGQVIAAAATTISANVIDRTNTLNAVSNFGAGRAVDIFIAIPVSSGTGLSIAVTLCAADSADLTTTNSVILVTTQTLTVTAGVPASLRVTVPSIPGGVGRRYWGLKYITAGTTPSFTITAGIVCDEQSSAMV
jgi:hypothetical protein